ncbi:hypothetical protein Dsin_028641 [Dipteronia sinensis]|uniref:F-box domain-containing protein n=1 Tax=Dipteronia sinensis TaxID=43782 RepID=A0AAD9ZRP5_9ROSI|nr:hypothetical protein Dsin_028641 [Dipteronia sinensis]
MKNNKMGIKRLKTAELMVRRDPLMELPNGILSKIISLLPLREAIRTSILSKSWKSIWTCHSDLKFDSLNVLGSRAQLSPSTTTCMSKSSRRKERRQFVQRVDELMIQRCKGLKMNSLAAHFHLGKEFSSHINDWISCAVMKEVESIDLNLSKSCSHMNCACSTKHEHYKFDCGLLAAPGSKSNLKFLKLDSCIFSVPLISNCLNSLITLELRRVCISDEMLKKLLSNCLLLETLSLHCCQDLVNLNFDGSSLRLKFLRIQECLRLNELEISSENVRRLEYSGPVVSFSFKHVPNLVEAFLCFTQKNRLSGVTYALTRLASELPQLEKLNLLSILSMNVLKLPDNGPAFIDVKELILSIYPFHDEDRLSWIAYILRTFPWLHKLQLNLFSPSFIKPPEEIVLNKRNNKKQAKEIERLLPECPHKHLNELEMNGFYGEKHEVELLKYLLENSVALKVLTVNPCQKVFRGFNNWVCEKESSLYMLTRKTVSDLLRELVPTTVRLKNYPEQLR